MEYFKLFAQVISFYLLVKYLIKSIVNVLNHNYKRVFINLGESVVDVGYVSLMCKLLGDAAI